MQEVTLDVMYNSNMQIVINVLLSHEH